MKAKKRKKGGKKDSSRVLKIRRDGNYACVYLNKKKVRLGRYGSPEAEVAFRQLQVQVFTDPTLSSLTPREHITVDVLCAGYKEYVKEHDPSHYYSIKTAVDIFLENFKGCAIDSLDSRHFLILQDKFVDHGVSRRYCNVLMGFVRAMLKWGAIRKIASPLVLAEAKLIPALKKGKTRAPEKPPRKNVPDEVVNRTLPHLLPTIRSIVEIQRATGSRPSEICRMKVGEIDQKGYVSPDGVTIWLYVPGTHKNDWRDQEDHQRIIPLGKLEQRILIPRLVGKSDDDYVFSPRDTEQERRERDAAKRKTKVQPSQILRKKRNAKKPKRERTPYTSEGYNRALTYAIEAANKKLSKGKQIPSWTPYQLRHSAVTNIALAHGLDIARATVGQKSLEVAQGYNHSDVRIAIEQAVLRSR